MCSWLNTVNSYFYDHIQRDEKSSIAEIVRNLNSKVRDPETPDVIKELRKSYEDEFQHTIYDLSNAIKDASPQFIEDMNIILQTYENNTFVEVLLDNMVIEFFLL